MKITELYNDYGIQYKTEGKNVAPGWVNVKCVWCDDPSEHLGYNTENDTIRCWRCGVHSIADTIGRLLKISPQAARSVIRQYGGDTAPTPRAERQAGDKDFSLPSLTNPLTEGHKRYLRVRSFDPEKLTTEWGLLGTGPVSFLDNIDYKHRIIIPIYWDSQVVSFTGRDITAKSPLRYRSCPVDREAVPHKQILYGRQEKWGTVGICVEGPTDVWRFGPSAFATFGIEFTVKQVKVIAERFKRVNVVFDGEPQAQRQADKLVSELRIRGIEAIRVDIQGDPGGMSQSDADYLVRFLLGGQK